MNLVQGLKKKAFEVALGDSSETTTLKSSGENEVPSTEVAQSGKQERETMTDPEENISSTDVNPPDLYTPYFREYKILIEYKHLPNYVPSGVYVLPSNDSLFVWHCAIFIRQGLYRKGIFKFAITIPPNYPEECPAVKFFSSVYHPQVGSNGELDVAREFPKWDTEKNYIWHVIGFVKSIFYQINLKDPLNLEAADLIVKDRPAFEARVKDCVQSSIDGALINPEKSGLQFTEWQKEHDVLRSTILGQKSEKESLLSWVSNSLGSVSKILNIKY